MTGWAETQSPGNMNISPLKHMIAQSSPSPMGFGPNASYMLINRSIFKSTAKEGGFMHALSLSPSQTLYRHASTSLLETRADKRIKLLELELVFVC